MRIRRESDGREMQRLIMDGPVTQPCPKTALRIGIVLRSECPGVVASTLSAAATIARNDPRFELVAAAVNNRIAGYAREDRHVRGGWIELVELQPATFPGRLLYGARQIYADNLDFFASLDILLTADDHAPALRSHFGLDDLDIVPADLAVMPPAQADRLLPHFFASLRAGEHPAH